MGLATILSRASLGLEAPSVVVEVHLSNGLPSLNIVGLPDTAIKEAKERVRSALSNSHFSFPAQRITINLAPADLPKDGGRFDLPIALGILVASGQLPEEALEKSEFLGELALSGELRPINSIIPSALAVKRSKRTLFIPHKNASEAACIQSLSVFGAGNLLELCAHLRGNQSLPKPTVEQTVPIGKSLDLADVKGQYQARRALEICAAGGHNLLYYGPPGTGKSLLASRLPSILPGLSNELALDVSAIHSIAGETRHPRITTPPFRSPHHSASSAALVGGGGNPKPGEISLAHQGVLFLDEIAEYPRGVLDSLREPMESGEINIARAQRSMKFPAQFQLIAAMNPCPCGYFGEPRCRCTTAQVQRYRQRLSGPLLDRIDLQIAVPRIPPSELRSISAGEPSQKVKNRVERANRIQVERQGCLNAKLSGTAIDKFAPLSNDLGKILDISSQKMGLSARAYYRIIRMARTIADLSESKEIEKAHLLEAMSYRQLDRASTTQAS